MQPRTPKSITPSIQEFCEQVAPSTVPVFLKVTPAAGASPADCFPTVDRQVADKGGERVMGWEIWEHPGVMVEAELHAVWRAPDGQLHDLTPKPDQRIDQILFLADPGRQYEGRQVNNVRRALRDTPAVRAFIEAADAEFEFMNRGDRANQHGELVLQGAEAAEWDRIQHRKLLAQLEANRPFMVAGLANGRNSPCTCGSGRKWKKCHGEGAP